MRIISFSIFILFMWVKISTGQELHIGYAPGYGSFSMEGMKGFNSTIQRKVPFQTKITHDFPNYYTHHIYVNYFIGSIGLGINYSTYSTGSRISRTDYSGEYFFDTKLKGFAPGVNFSIRFYNGQRIKVFQYNIIENLKTEITINEVLNLKDVGGDINDEFEFSVKNIQWEPGIKVIIPLSVFRVGLFSGYDFSVKLGEIKSEDPKYQPTNLDEIDWNGWRIGASIAIDFIQFSKL